MKGVVGLATGVAAAVIGLLTVLARTDPETAFHAEIIAQLLVVILIIVAVSSLFAILYLSVLGDLGRRFIEDRFSVFVAWNLLRSHKVRPTVGSRSRIEWNSVRSLPWRSALPLLAQGAGLLGLAWLIEQPRVFNLLAEEVSPGLARAVQLSALTLGVLRLGAALPRLVRAKRQGSRVKSLNQLGCLLAVAASTAGLTVPLLTGTHPPGLVWNDILFGVTLVTASIAAEAGNGWRVWLALGPLFVGVLSVARAFFNSVLVEVAPASFWVLLGCGLALIAGAALMVHEPQEDGLLHTWRARTQVTLPTFMSIVGVSIGIWALIVVLGVMHGFADDLESKILRTNAHVVVEPEDQNGALGDDLALEEALRGLPNVTEADAQVYGEVMIASPTNIAVNVVVKGMEPQAIETSEQLRGRFTEGGPEWLGRPETLASDRFRYPRTFELDDRSWAIEDPAGEFEPITLSASARVLPGILVGAELARSLNVAVGSEVQVITPDGDVGPTGLRPKLRDHRVAGVFQTGMYEYDQKLAYLAIDDAQQFFNMGSDTNRLELRTGPDARSEDVLSAVRGVLGDRFGELKATGWRERNQNLFSALELERIAMFIVLGFIVLVASLLIVSSLVMIIVERARDIAVLKSLGASNRSVVRVFLIIGAFIGAIGTISGLTLGVTTCAVVAKIGIALPQQYYIPLVPVKLDPFEVTVIGVSAFLICLLATVYPSWAASRLRPVEGLRHG